MLNVEQVANLLHGFMACDRLMKNVQQTARLVHSTGLVHFISRFSHHKQFLRLASQSLHKFSQTRITIPPHTQTTYVRMSQNMLALTNCMLVAR